MAKKHSLSFVYFPFSSCFKDERFNEAMETREVQTKNKLLYNINYEDTISMRSLLEFMALVHTREHSYAGKAWALDLLKSEHTSSPRHDLMNNTAIFVCCISGCCSINSLLGWHWTSKMTSADSIQIALPNSMARNMKPFLMPSVRLTQE